ncbi:MAG: hypothetical protein IKZ49_00455 [Alphaproteobacteria bacterium]|nr:hypothetical protein [Alphaproteobacteria bacterium]
MTSKVKLYKAQIGNKKLKVDINNLPYGEFNSENPLVILEKITVDTPFEKQIDFANVKFKEGIEIPQKDMSIKRDPIFEEMVGLGGKIDKEFLKNPFARRVMTLVFDVRDYEIPESEKPKEQVKQEVVKKEKPVKKAKKTKTEEPVVVEEPVVAKPVDEKPVVTDVVPVLVAEEQVDVVPVLVEKEQIIVEPITTPIKTSDFVSINDIFKICVANPYIKSFDLSDNELEQEIRKIFKTFDNDFYADSKTNSKVKCIAASNIAELIKKLQAVLQKSAHKRVAIKQKTDEKQTKKQAQKEAEEKRKHLVSSKSVALLPIVIKKYIPKKLWKDICRECGNDKSMQKMILENISLLNTDINETPSSTHIQIINPQTSERYTLSSIKRKSAYCIVQTISGNIHTDGKRIIYTYLPDDKILVCTGIFSEHSKAKNANGYKILCKFASAKLDASGKKLTKKRVIDEGYIEVSDLLNDEKSTQVLSEIPKSEPTNSVATRSGDSIKTQLPEPETIEEVKSDKKPYFSPATKIEQKAESVVQIDTPHDLLEVKVAEAKIKSLIDLITKNVNQTLVAITTEEDVAKQLEQLDLTREALVQKAKYMNILAESNKTNELLQKMRAYMNTRIK